MLFPAFTYVISACALPSEPHLNAMAAPLRWPRKSRQERRILAMYTCWSSMRRSVDFVRERFRYSRAPEHALRFAAFSGIAVALATTSCSLDTSPVTSGQSQSGQASARENRSSKFEPAEAPGSLGATDAMDASLPMDPARSVVTATKQDAAAVTADDDAGTTGTSSMPDASTTTATADAGTPKDAGRGQDMPDAGATATTTQSVDPECTRSRLREKVDAFLQAMANGDASTLRLHPSLRVTENGQVEQLSAGVWQRRGKATFARHVLDERSCSTLTQAVLSTLTGRITYGVRLRYVAGQLLEVESHTVNEGAAGYENVDAIPPVGPDPWNNEIPSSMRMSREELIETGEQYFSAATGGKIPPSTPECRRRQNGEPLAMMGSCSALPGTHRFQEQRFSVVDELAGIATATVLYDTYLGFYMFKMASGEIQNIEVVGGISAASSGW